MKINGYLEHTALKQGMTEINIRDNLELCVAYNVPVIVIPPSFVKYASSLNIKEKISICTVIGFPLGYNTLKTKLFEMEEAISNGADEIDLVIDNSLLKENNWDIINYELAEYRKACEGKILKIIVETSLLSRSDLDNIVNSLINNRVDFIKTSTGFVGGGAKLEDIKFLKIFFGNKIKIKASGGIKTKDQALEFIDAGADRIGSSSTKLIIEN
ncbi:MAG: deoxyribose-phosphate aldolase [Candidatus Delongbacteria bacterium]|nr:deoxyribose-phosphate aldolase [Candidatus Delongbacteria bacterium]MCG2761268.1 deoxyribose-phosphate aldolase [Candidatus Delongbacteria bacterium]